MRTESNNSQEFIGLKCITWKERLCAFVRVRVWVWVECTCVCVGLRVWVCVCVCERERERERERKKETFDCQPGLTSIEKEISQKAETTRRRKSFILSFSSLNVFNWKVLKTFLWYKNLYKVWIEDRLASYWCCWHGFDSRHGQAATTSFNLALFGYLYLFQGLVGN